LRKFLYIIILLFVVFSALQAQTTGSDRYVQVSGIISDETGRVVQGAVVISHRLKRAALSEYTGIYSIISVPGDTISFRALGYKRYHTIIPNDYAGRFASVDIRLEFDTIQIEAVNIMPWNTYSEFIRDITQERPVDPIVENMNENLASIYVALQNEIGLRISSEAAYRYVMEQQFSAMSTKNQYPANNLLNPFAWAKFVQGMKTGLLKNHRFEKPKEAKVRKKINNAENK
jgi:hypothetical protein